MTSSSAILQSLRTGTDVAPLRAKWGWIVALGFVYVVAGFVALGSVVMATVASVFVVGVMMIVAGVAELFNAFQVKSWGKFLIWGLLGVLYIVAGFVTFENPLFAAVLLTLILGASLVASGVVRIFLAFNMKREMPWIWVALSGVITLLVGLVILVHWPVNSVYILGLFLGIDLIMAGAGWIGLGLGLHRVPAARPA
ncbi:MAG TPA: HdeD family acid-resistance protein [Bradyrhizobium sp.]|uniref:HdeD family acid-resistance protein n=1 Tax=Bradyrhizobium sp. TaxID=376 RepID=UPI002BBC423F|nr:HdeD family acid-resistance protein [Bradyrhizobium sp.]HLZ03752.1 HdeD family acid-resistance protein [Bradyrhizobium sp.]